VFESHDMGPAICSLSIHPNVKATAHLMFAPSPKTFKFGKWGILEEAIAA
jgi:hypothetical protein